MKLAIGKLRGIQQVADDNGFLTICAIDHRGALRQALNKDNPDSVSYQDMVDFKLDLCRAVTPFASAVLLDPIYGAGQAVAAGVLPGHTGLLVSMEKTGYSGSSTARITELLPDWSVRKAKKLGASAVKLLVYFRPDLKELASKQLDLIANLSDQCLEEDMALLVEPVTYPVEQVGISAKEFADIKPGLVIDTARQITALSIDVLKAEFPADMKFEQDEGRMLGYCQELDEASRTPWVILSAGVDFETFKKQVEIACKAGASGFLAGRALWQEGTHIPSREGRMDFFRNTSAPRLQELAMLVTEHGKPWHSKAGIDSNKLSQMTEDWHTEY